MHMNGDAGLFNIPSEHLPGLIALIAFPLAWWVALHVGSVAARRGSRGAVALQRRYRSLSGTGRLALFGLGLGAAVHAAIVPTHWGGARITAVLFVVGTVGMVAGAVWTLLQRRGWRIAAFGMLAGTAAGYGLYLVMHWETADLVGVTTSAVELGAALILLAPERSDVRVSGLRTRWQMVGSMLLALCAMLGTVAIADSGHASAAMPRAGGATGSPTSGGMSMGSAGAHPVSLPSTSPAGAITWPLPAESMPVGMTMVPPNCSRRPTQVQSKAAVALVDATVAGVAPYRSLAAAKSAGYVPVTPTGARIVHYINYSVLEHSSPLDPTSVPVLVYVNTRHGAVLSAAMYLMTARDGRVPPQPGGCLTVWHIHTDLCFSGAAVTGTESSGSCPAGQSNSLTEPMLHVWLAPVDGGPLAVDPGGLAEVVAAWQLPAVDPPNPTA
jgi:hypothetical protein